MCGGRELDLLALEEHTLYDDGFTKDHQVGGWGSLRADQDHQVGLSGGGGQLPPLTKADRDVLQGGSGSA